MRVIAIRIYYGGIAFTPYADLRLANGEIVTIQWNLIAEREKYEPYIDAYTLYYDERKKRDWKGWIR